MLGTLVAAGSVVAILAQAPQTPAASSATAVGNSSWLSVANPARRHGMQVPDFVALSPDAADTAKMLGQVLWDELNFEREFYMIPRDTVRDHSVARTPEDVPFNAWRSLALMPSYLERSRRPTPIQVRVQVRLFNVRSRQSVFAKEYTGAAATPRLYAHTISDEIHQQQRALRGVARTKLAFSSDRNREKVSGPVQNRDVKEVYIADYDGENQRRVTTNRQLNITPVWSPDARGIAYTSYRRGYPDIFIALIYQGIQETPTNGVAQNWLPIFSPDGRGSVSRRTATATPSCM
jgi:TolB protein